MHHHPPSHVYTVPAATISIDIRHSGPKEYYSLTPGQPLPSTTPPISISGSPDATLIDLSGLNSPAILVLRLVPGASGIPYTYKSEIRDTISTTPLQNSTPKPWTGPDGEFDNIALDGDTALYICYSNKKYTSTTSKFLLNVIGPNGVGHDPQIKNGSTTIGKMTPYCTYSITAFYDREGKRRHRHHRPNR